MAYIGNKPTVGNFQICDAISVVNGQAAYTMQVGSVNVIPQSANHMIVSLNGTIQKPNSSFTVSGSTITFSSNLATGDVIDFIQILGDVLDLGVPSDATVTLAKLSATGTKDATTFLRGDNTFAEAGGGIFESALLHVQDQKSQGTNGGSAGDNATPVRDLNTVLTNEITGASLGSNRVTLPSGTYYISAKAPASHCNSHQIFWYNYTDSSIVLTGQNSFNSTAGDAESTTHSFLTGRFTIASSKVFHLGHRINSNSPTVGLGRDYGGTNTPPYELYTDINIWKVA
jgi:hypothetical protein